MIGIRNEEVSIFPLLMDPRIGVNIALLPQTLTLPAVQEIVIDAASQNIGTKRNMPQFCMYVVDGTTPVQSESSGTSTPDLHGISGTRINIVPTPSPSGISKTSAVPTCVVSGNSAAPLSGGI